MTKKKRGLGRVYIPDPRDMRHLFRFSSVAVIKEQKSPWRLGPVLDQGQTPECVVYTLADFLGAAPICSHIPWPKSRFDALYHQAQIADEWPGEDYDGTSARGALKVAQQLGWVSSYEWLTDEDSVKLHLTHVGTLMAGCDWYNSMFETDSHGYVEPSAGLAGGHETLLRWYYPPTHKRYPDTYEFRNHWGEWGDKGNFRMKADVFRYLFFQANGDLVSPVQAAHANLR